jgi:acetyl esterase/lipase
MMSIKTWSHLTLIIGLCVPASATSQAVPVGIDLARSYAVRSDVVYHVASGRELTLDLYVPQGASGPVPIIVYYHGGGWVVGDRHSQSLRLLPYLEQGFAVANVTYRLASTALAPAAVVDAVCALRWVSANAADLGLDSDRIVVTGTSAGGHLALMAGMLPWDSPFASECQTLAEAVAGTFAPARAAAIVNWFGVSDVADLLVEPHRRVYAEQWVGAVPNREEVARLVSPLEYMRGALPPLLTIHGDADAVVPYEHAVQITQAFRGVGAAAELITVAGGHGGFSVEQEVDAYARIWTFLEELGLLP